MLESWRRIRVVRHRASVTGSWGVILFLLGFFSGFAFRGFDTVPVNKFNDHEDAPRRGFITHISKVSHRPTSHMDGQGRPITKQQLVDPFVIPNFAGFSIATLQPGQTLAEHSHESMVELFYVLSGSGKVQIDGQETSIAQGHFIEVVPGERHAFDVQPTEEQAMVMLFCGITTGPKPNSR
jgi:quercetin dioxygenase-like cupin family protein